MKLVYMLIIVVLLATTVFAEELSQKLKDYQKAIAASDFQAANQLTRTMNDTEKKQARKIYVITKKQQKEAKKKQEIETQKKLTPARKEFAKKYEQDMLQKGLDVYASTLGKDHSTFKIKFILTSRPLVYKLANDEGFTGTLKGLGFKKLVMTDGYNDTWTVKLD